MGTLLKKLGLSLQKSESYLMKPLISEEKKMNDRLNQIIPPFVPKISVLAKAKHTFRTILRSVLIISTILIVGLSIFLGYRIIKNFDSVWHYLKNDQTIAFTLTNQKTVQDAAIDDVLDQLTQPGKTLQQTLIDLAVSGYAQSDQYQKGVVVYDDKLRSAYQLTFEERIQKTIDIAYQIYNKFDPHTEREVYGITTDELVYQRRLQVPGYAPMTLRSSLFEGRRYFPFALIAGQVAGVDPLRLLKIFEIETNFDETTVGRNTGRVINDDIGIAQNNLAVLPRLIRDILDPSSPVYSPFFEFLDLGNDLETGELLTWSHYLSRLEQELNGTCDPETNPTGREYINRLKAPHIGAFLAAYHLKRDETYRLYDRCMDFYQTNAAFLKIELKLARDLDPYHWTDYSFYNGGPKRWYVMKKFIQMRKKLLFSAGEEFQVDLDEGKISGNLRSVFENHGITLSQNVMVAIDEAADNGWLITDRDKEQRYFVSKNRDKLKVFGKNNQSIPRELTAAVQITSRRNILVQRIGQKNEYLRSLAYDSVERKTIENDGLSQYGLYDFAADFEPRDLMCNLNRDLAATPR